jgi:hypothetical protein
MYVCHVLYVGKQGQAFALWWREAWTLSLNLLLVADYAEFDPTRYVYAAKHKIYAERWLYVSNENCLFEILCANHFNDLCIFTNSLVLPHAVH